jgi:diguanylate cyclase (GGDEF)-like protein/PAS domain S-box-containing protein
MSLQPGQFPSEDELYRRLREGQVLLDGTTIGVMLTRDHLCCRINPRGAAMFGYQPDELTDASPRLLFADDASYQHFLDSALPPLRQGERFSAEWEMRHRDGHPLYIRFSGRHVETGRPELGVLWLAEDITEQRQARLALQRALQEGEAILNTVVAGIALLRHRRIERCNRRMEELFGYGKDEMIGCSTRVWYGDEEVWQSLAEVYTELAAGREAHRELWYQRRDGTRFWGRLAGRAFDPAQPHEGSVWIIEDITREKEEHEELVLARKVFEVNSEAIMVTDAQNRIVRVNAAFEAITGYCEAEVLGSDPKILGSGRHSPEFFRSLWQTLLANGHWEGEIWDLRKDGTEYPKWLHIDTIRDGDGNISHHVAVFSDISERKASEERIRYLAQHDALTGLPNRFTLAVHLEHALARAERSKDKIGVMFIDLDNFKTINDTLGHHIGDLLLCEVARRISSAVRKSDIVARIGGDEFVVVLEAAPRLPVDAGTVAQKILERVSEPIRVDGNDLHTTPSIGIGIFPDDGADIETLMKNADVAMYHAKGAGRNNFQFYAEHMNRAAAIRIQIENRLRAALQNDELSLNYQPQVALGTQGVSGVEALIRWYNAELGQISPASFIPLAEEIGLIVPIGEWVLRTACVTAKRWLDAGIDFGVMAVNISPQQFRQRNFPERVETILAETGLPPERLELEITESTIMETAEIAIAMLVRLKELGLSLSVDDFGTGYSSLAYLKRFPIERLKIDRSFISDLENDPTDAAIASAVIALAHSLSLEVVAEGVETQTQADFLLGQGCDSVQGYFFSRPVTADAAADFCRQRGMRGARD